MNSCVSTSVFVVLQHAQLQTEIMKTMWSREAQLWAPPKKNSSHIVKTAIRSCRCGAAALEAERARSGRESRQDDGLQKSPGRSTLHTPDGRRSQADCKTHFSSPLIPSSSENRGSALTERRAWQDGPPTSTSLLSLLLSAGGPTQTCTFTPPLGSGESRAEPS